jgi:hypothetical protein
VVEDPAQGGVQVSFPVNGPGLLGSVGAQQIMAGEPAGDVLFEQAAAGQLGQRTACAGQRDPAQAGGGQIGNVWTRMHAEQPEQPCRGLAQTLIGPGQHGPDVTGRFPGLQRLQPVSLVA